MNYNFVDSDLIEINDNVELEICNIPDTSHNIFIIDNFLKNPEYLREIASKQTFEKTPFHRSNNPGWVSTPNLRFNQILKTAEYIAKNYCGIVQDEKLTPVFQFNLFQGGMECRYRSLVPHVDNSFFAFQLYLNLPEECMGGTNFYRNTRSGLEHNVEYFDEEFKRTEQYWELTNYLNETKENDFNTVLDYRQIDPNDWETIYKVEMKYNRFILYPSYVFHTAYIEKEWFQDPKRIGLVGFLK